MWNVHIHRMFIIIGIRKIHSRNWFRYENFIHLFEFKGFSTRGERDRIFLCWQLLHRQLSTQPTRSVRSAQSRLASSSSESQPSFSEAGTQLTDFSQILQILRTRFRCMTSFTSPGHISIWYFYFDISEWHILPARAWTPAFMLRLTNAYVKREVLSLTKPKGKIYKTKSLRNYVTLLFKRKQDTKSAGFTLPDAVTNSLAEFSENPIEEITFAA